MSQNEWNDHCTEVASTRDNRSVDWAWFQLGEILAEIADSSTQRESGVLRCGVACVWAWPPGAKIGNKALPLVGGNR
jgi:hypothetical protein